MAEEKPLDMPTMEVSQSVAITTSHCTSTKSTFSDIAKEIKPYDSGLVSSISGVNSLTKKSLADASKEIVNLKRPLVEDEKVESKKPLLVENGELKKNNALFVDRLFNIKKELIVGDEKFKAENQPFVENKVKPKTQPLVENNYVESKEQHLIEDKETKPKHTEVKPKICNEHSLSFKGTLFFD